MVSRTARNRPLDHGHARPATNRCDSPGVAAGEGTSMSRLDMNAADLCDPGADGMAGFHGALPRGFSPRRLAHGTFLACRANFFPLFAGSRTAVRLPRPVASAGTTLTCSQTVAQRGGKVSLAARGRTGVRWHGSCVTPQQNATAWTVQSDFVKKRKFRAPCRRRLAHFPIARECAVCPALFYLVRQMHDSAPGAPSVND